MIGGPKSSRFSGGKLGFLRQRGFINIALRRGLMGKPFSVLDLFRSGEQGYWYDSSDLSSMYQDAAAQTSAYAPGQGSADCPIGYRCDKRLGLSLGVNLAANSGFDSGVSWTLGAGWSISGGVASITASASTNAISQNLGTTGKLYEFTYTVVSVSGTGVRVYSGGNNGVARTVPGTFTERVACGSTNAALGIGCVAAGASASIDNFTIREVLGNHAFQSVAGSRPTLSARYNLLIKSEVTDVAPWVFSNPSTTATRVGNAYTFGANANDRITQTTATVTAFRHTASVTLSGSGNVRLVAYDGAAAGGVPLDIALTATPTTYSLSRVFASAGATGGLGILNNSGGIAGASFTIWNADLRITDDATKAIPAYQRVVDASTYDTAGFPWYLKCDGFDDGMVTNTIDFTATDKMTVWAGVTKLSDAANGIVTELSADGSANNGSFNVFAPVTGSAAYRFVSKGTSAGSALVANATYPAPHTAVVTGIGDIANDTDNLRVNTSATTGTVLDQGTGNYGNYPIYLFRRGGASNPLNGRDYGQIVRGAASTAAQVSNVERYYARAMGLSF